jgi:hypothetical protein
LNEEQILCPEKCRACTVNEQTPVRFDFGEDPKPDALPLRPTRTIRSFRAPLNVSALSFFSWLLFAI